jgi:hypothetical protein
MGMSGSFLEFGVPDANGKPTEKSRNWLRGGAV